MTTTLLQSPLRSPLQRALSSPLARRFTTAGITWDFAATVKPLAATGFRRGSAGLATLIDESGDVVYGDHNLQRNSENLSGAGWSTNAVSVSSGPVPPSPYATSSTVTGNGANDVHWVLGEGATGPKRARYVVKAGTHSFVQILWSGASGIYANFDLTNGVLGVVTTSAQDIIALGSGWYEIYAETSSTSTGTPFLLLAGSASAGWYIPDVVSGTIHVTGAQSAAIPSSLTYVPTTSAEVYLPRYTYHPTTHAALGLLIEPQVTQLYHSHSLASPALVTQNTTVTAQPYTMQFVGSGTVTLSGAHTATVVGLGAGLTKTLTFTPSAGTLTSTPSGTCDYPQLEAGSVATSYIPNATSGSLVRTSDGNWDITGSDFTQLWGSGSERTIVVEWYDTGTALEHGLVMGHVGGSVANEAIGLYVNTSNALIYYAKAGGAAQATLTAGTIVAGTLAAPGRNKAAFRFGAGAFGVSLNGAAEVTGTGTIPTVTDLRVAGAALVAANPHHDILKALGSRPTAITGAALQALSAL